MTTDRIARGREAMRHQAASHTVVETPPDARSMGAESAEYTAPMIDPQWINAWKMFVDRDGNEYGVPVKLPKGQWSVGGPNALENQRRPDGGYWFTLVEPERKEAEKKHECFVGDCTKRASTLIKLVGHVEAFHHEEASAYTAVLKQIKEQVANEDPRLQRVLASLRQGVGAPAPEEEVEAEVLAATRCHSCGEELTGKLADHTCEEGA